MLRLVDPAPCGACGCAQRPPLFPVCSCPCHGAGGPLTAALMLRAIAQIEGRPHLRGVR